MTQQMIPGLTETVLQGWVKADPSAISRQKLSDDQFTDLRDSAVPNAWTDETIHNCFLVVI